MTLGLFFFLVKSVREASRLYGCPWQLTIQSNKEGFCCLHQICLCDALITQHISQTCVSALILPLPYGYERVLHPLRACMPSSCRQFGPRSTQVALISSPVPSHHSIAHLALQLRPIYPIHQQDKHVCVVTKHADHILSIVGRFNYI